MRVELQITAQGGIQMLHSDAVNLADFGPGVEIRRASHVEPYTTGSGQVRWMVVSAKTDRLLQPGFETREAALTWEKSHYSPTGPGWSELTGEL